MATRGAVGTLVIGRETNARRAEAESASWLLLLHQIPAKPDYLRVKIWRRMQRIGASNLKNAAWVLPATDAGMEDFQWLMREIEADGGDAVLCEARFLAGLTEEQVNVLEGVSAREKAARVARGQELAKGQTELGIDGVTETFRRRVWVTRRNVHVDRIASAWLIRRAIDPEARFKFVPAHGYVPEPGELRFDMYEAEFTHVGDACTFEVLAGTFAPGDGALAALAEIVHDIDFKDTRFGRAETAGVAALINGICAAIPDDADRLAQGTLLLDNLYAAFELERGN